MCHAHPLAHHTPAGISAGAMDKKKGGKGRKSADEDGSGSGEDEKPAAPPPKKAKAEPKSKKESAGGSGGGDKEAGPSKPKAGKKAEKEVVEGGESPAHYRDQGCLGLSLAAVHCMGRYCSNPSCGSSTLTP